MTAKPELNRDDFIKWLETKPLNVIVGMPKSPVNCPLCNFLKSLGHPAPVVSLSWYSTEPMMYVDMPGWATDFQRMAIASHSPEMAVHDAIHVVSILEGMDR